MRSSTISRCAGRHLLFIVAIGIGGCRDLGQEPAGMTAPPPTPPPSTTGVSFLNDVRPIFANPTIGCLGCHGGTNGLFLGTRQGVLAGGNHGPAVVPGNSAASLLIQKMSATPPFGVRMPDGGNPVPDSLVQKIRNWIDQGALDN
jgi:hypothetical protein